MKSAWFTRQRIAILLMFMVFLALVRCLLEIYLRDIQSVNEPGLRVRDIRPFLDAAMMDAVACLVLVILYMYNRFREMIFLAAATIAAMLWIKFANGL